MKKRLIALMLTLPVILGGCSNIGNQVQNPAASSNEAAATSTPTPSPTPTPVPLPANHINAPEEWTEIPDGAENAFKPDWLSSHRSVMEWDSGQGATIISSIVDKTPGDAANDVIVNYENSMAANVYATAGDCVVETIFFGNAIGMFISPKWNEETYCCFVVGNISSGIGWELMSEALANYEQFSMYDYNMSKLLYQRISIEGQIRTMDDSYWGRLTDQAMELSGWTFESDPDYRNSVLGLYKLMCAQNANTDITDASLGQSETVYSNGDGFRIVDVHLPEGYDKIEAYFNTETKERGVYISNNTVSLIVEGMVPQKYSDYLADIIWNEKEFEFWEDTEEEPEEETVPTEGEGNEAEPTEEPKPTEETAPAEDDTEPGEIIRLIEMYSCQDGAVYVFAEVPEDTPDDAKPADVELTGYTVVYYQEDGAGCSLYLTSKLFDTKRRMIEFVKQIFG